MTLVIVDWMAPFMDVGDVLEGDGVVVGEVLEGDGWLDDA